MSKGTFTPGPWRLDQMLVTSFFAQVPIAEIRCSMHPKGTPEANAQLIAAAPELLEACKAGLDWLTRLEELGANISIGDVADEQPTFEQLRAAIAKAEGQS